MHETDSEQLVCYCVNGHMQRIRGRFVPSNCSICNAPIDMNRMFVPPIQEKKQESEAVTQEPETAAQEPKVVAQESVQTSEPRPLPLNDAFPAHPPQRTIPSVPPVSRPPTVPGIPVAPRRVPQMPPAAPPAVRVADQQVHAQPVIFQLDYFGEKIAIPDEGGWLGRSALGGQLFEGNLLISREHVRVQPTMDGGLQIGPDHSLNGTYIDTGTGKSKLGNESLIVAEGTVVWLFNIPLRVERKKQ